MSPTKVKRSHSFDADASEAIEEFGADNRSKYVNDAVLERAARDRALAFLVELDDDLGAVPDVDDAAAQLSYHRTLLRLAERRHDQAVKAARSKSQRRTT